MSNTLDYISGGKLGDFLHVLMVVKQNYLSTGKKGNLYLSTSHGGDGFSHHVQKVLEDTKDLILSQDYINSYELHNGQEIHINLNNWRVSKNLYRKCWIDLLSETYRVAPIKTNWLEYSKVSDYQDFTIIHRGYHRHNDKFPWDEIVSREKCLFVTTNPGLAKLFKENYPIESIVVNTISEMALVINSGKKFVGNMSAPLALAHALGKPRLAELTSHDQVHYIEDEKYLHDFWYIKDHESQIPKDYFK